MIGTRLAQRYELLQELGRGGMGVVHLARDPHLDREVAIKILSVGDLGPSAEERFLREAHLVARMDHPSIVPIYDLGRDDDLLFFVMPVVRGSTLLQLHRRGDLPFADILEIIAQVGDALDYSHQRGVVHRDIKPENIMVSREDGNLRGRVMDFGLALGDAASRLTKTGNLPGTLAYLSPEQILAVEVDGRSDLYSLATILYECLTGKAPFTGSRYALLYQIVNENPPSMIGHGIDAELDQLILAALAKDPAARPSRGSEFASQLRHYAEAGLTAGQLNRQGLHLDGGLADQAAPALVGRSKEMAELRQRLALAADGECQLLLIGGEAGMGKTRLLEELEQIGRVRGFRTLHGRFSDQESSFPFQAFGELIQDFYLSKEIASSSATALPDLRDLEDDLCRLFPALSELPMIGMPLSGESPDSSESSISASSSSASSSSASSSSAQNARPTTAGSASNLLDGTDISDDFRTAGGSSPGFALAAARRGDPTHLFEILARALARLSSGKPTLYLLEHLHGAELSIEALQYIVRRLGPTPSLFAATYRLSETPRRHPLNKLLKTVRDEPRFGSLQLEPLSDRDVEELVISKLGDGELSRELAERLYEATEGNPFFTLEIVRSLIDEGEVHRNSSGIWGLSEEAALFPGALPETIQQVVETRLERLPGDLLEVLQMASVLGRTFDFPDLEDLTKDNQVEAAVEKLLGEGLLHEDRQARSDLLHFTSGVVRDALYTDLSRRRRRLLHRRHARHLEDRYAGRLSQVYPQLVHHFAAGDVAEKTIEYALELARNSLDAVGVKVAIRVLRTALDFVEDEDVAAETEGELRFLLARALRTEGSGEAAVKEAARAVRSFQQHNAAAAAAAALLAAETSWQGRRVSETRRWVEKGIDLARATGSTEPLRKLLTLGATVANLRGEYQKARLRWEEAQDLGATASPTVEPLPSGGTLTAAASVEIGNFDPRRALTIEEKEVLANVFQTLIESDAEGHLSPCLCEDWEKSTDGRSFLFRLRRDACFSDGTLMVAEDVRHSLASPHQHRPPPACSALAGADEFFAGQSETWPGIEVLDEHTVRFHLRAPLPIFPILLSDLNASIFRESAGDHLLGTGPFAIESHSPASVRLVRNPRYWRGSAPLLDSIEFQTFSDSGTAAAGLRSGSLDVGHDFRPDELDQLLRDARFRSGLVEATRQNVYLVAFNQHGPTTHDADVRRALVDVVRVQDSVWQTLGRFAQPASCLIPPGILGHDPGRRRKHLTREQASELLESRGLSLPIELRAVAHPLYFDRYRSFIETLFREWETIGIRVIFENTTREGYFAKSADPEGIDLWIGRWVADYDDPDNFTYGLIDSQCGLIGGYLRSEQIDHIVGTARQAERSAARQILYHKLESLLADQRALLPLFYDVDYRLVNPRVRGLRLLSRPPYVNYSEVAKVDDQAVVEPDRDSGVIHIPWPEIFGDLAPRQAQILGNVETVGNVFETLTRLDEGARIVPSLASEFRLEEGGRRFRFKLRNNVRFHDGRKLTVRDVRYSFEELIRGLGHEAFQANLVPIRGGRAFWEGDSSELEGFKILSANEFVIELERPLSFFPAMLTSASTAIVPEGTRRFDGNWRDGTVGTGPFRVLRFDPSERLELEAHPHYWRRGLPKSDRLVFEFGSHGDELVSELRSGRLALASNLRPSEVHELLLDPDFASAYRELPGFSTCFLILDTRRGPLADFATRTAFRRVIEDANLVRSCLGRLATPAQGLIPPGLLGHEPRPRRASEPEEPSPEQPLAGLELRTVVFPAFLGPFAPLWEGLTQALERAGARITTLSASPIEALWRIAHSEIDLAAARWVAGYPDPDALIHFFCSQGYLGQLVGQPEVDELFDRGRDETDPALRHTLYRQIDQSLSRHKALIPLFHEQVFRVGHPDLQGLRLRFGWPEVAYEELQLTP